MSKNSWKHWVVFVSLLCGGAGVAWSQANSTGTITGIVTDSSKAYVTTATVTATNKNTGTVRQTKTNGEGEYRFEQMPAGEYTIRIVAPGFTTLAVTSVDLLVGTVANANEELHVGAENQTVEVTTAVTDLVDTEKTSVSLNIAPSVVNELPLNGRDFANLAFLAPGVKPVDSYDPTKNRYAVYAVDGSGGRNTNTTVNGIDNKDQTIGGAVMQLPLEAVQEFIISTQRFSAANGRSEGAALNVVTKSGGNKFHGSAYTFIRSSSFQTPNEFSGSHKPGYHRTQAGGSVGGPILKDKLFGFGTFEGTRERSALTPSDATFNELTLAAPLGAIASRQIPTPFNDKRYNGRLDYTINPRNHVFVSYLAQDNNGMNDQATDTSDLTDGNYTINDLILANVSLNTLITPTIVNNFAFGYQYWNNLINTKNFTRLITFPGLLNVGTNANVPQQSYQGKFQFKDDVAIERGKHSFKFGVDVVDMPKFGGFFEFTAVPEVDFIDKPSVILSDKVTYPDGFATPGAVIGIAEATGDPYFDLPNTVKFYGFYVEDDWKLRPNLTFNIGLRYDKDSGLLGSDKQRLNRTFQELLAIGSPIARSVAHTDNLDFSPRVGFAYDVFGNGKHVVRGGYGLYFGQTFLNIPLFTIQQTNPTIFATVLSLQSSGPGDAGADVVPGTGGKLLSEYRYGVDPFPAIPPAPTQLPTGSRGRTIDPGYRNPYTEQFNLGYSYQVWRNGVIEVDAVHTLGLHDNKQININPRNPANGNARPLTAAFQKAGVPVLADVRDTTSGNKAFYNGLSVSYRQNLARNFSVNTNVTYSRATSYEGAAADYADTPTNPLLPPLRRQDYGPTPSNETWRFVLGGSYRLPLGFEIAPILQLATARPYDLTQGIDVYGVGSGRSAAHLIVPTGQPKNFGALANSSAADLRSCLAAGTCQEVHYNSASGKPFGQLDLRVSKTFSYRERINLKVFFQGFDITDRFNPGGNFDGNAQDFGAGFGTPTDFFTPGGQIIPRSFTGEFGGRLSF